MKSDIYSLKQAALRRPIEGQGLDPVTNFLNDFIALQASQSESELRSISSATEVADDQRTFAIQSLDAVHKVQRCGPRLI